MLERVVLHIGLAKTGTKTLQAAMTLNRDLLRRHGFVYPALPGERHAGLAVYATAVAGPDIHTAILSNEYCSTGLSTIEEIARLHRLLSSLAREIRVIVYLRRQDHLAASLYCNGR